MGLSSAVSDPPYSYPNPDALALIQTLSRRWQVWTAFGIMLGTVASLAFYHVGDTANITGLNWRLMLGS